MTVEHLKQRLVPLELQKDVVGDYSELVKGDCLAPWILIEKTGIHTDDTVYTRDMVLNPHTQD